MTKCPYLSDTGFPLLSLMDSQSSGSRLLLGCPLCFLLPWLTPPALEFASPRRMMSPDFQLLLRLDGSALQSHSGFVFKQARAQLSPFPANLQLVLVLRPTGFFQRTLSDLAFRFNRDDFKMKVPVSAHLLWGAPTLPRALGREVGVSDPPAAAGP